MSNFDINLPSISIEPMAMDYEITKYISEKTNRSITDVLKDVSKGNILVTTDKLSFSLYLYNRRVYRKGLRRDKVEASDILLWLDIVFAPYSDDIFTFGDKGKTYYIFVKNEGDKYYDPK